MTTYNSLYLLKLWMDLDVIWYAISLHVYEWIATKIFNLFPHFPPLGGRGQVILESRTSTIKANSLTKRYLSSTVLPQAGDVETPPGPTWACSICNRAINSNQTSVKCNHPNSHWVYRTCANITLPYYRRQETT